MRRFLFIFLFLQLTVLPSQAQRFKFLRPINKSALRRNAYPLRERVVVSRQLDKRLEQSYQLAEQSLRQIPDGRKMSIGEPAYRGLHTQDLDPRVIYPDVPFLTTPEQTASYLLSRNNRLFLQERKRMEGVWTEIDKYLPTLLEEAQQLKQPEDPILWLADEIPAGVAQLFIGETHQYPEIRQAIQQLITILRYKQPQRQIILFTEFLPEEVTWTNRKDQQALPQYLKVFFPFWESATQQRIQVIGLEPIEIVHDDCSCKYVTKGGKHREMSIWETLEGVRWRNERWINTLSSYRTKYPDALFIIYTGADHALYNRPFSLATHFPREQTFVTALYPQKVADFISDGKWWHAPFIIEKSFLGPVEQIHKQANFPQPVLKWSTPQLSQIAGFDVRLKIPVKLADLDY